MPYSDPDKQREYQRNWWRRRRERWFVDKSCARCGIAWDLQLHHRDPEQKLSHKIWSWSVERLEAELKKCEVLCDGCHREHHAEQMRYPHGTSARYDHGQCRCSACRAAKTQRMREYRSRKRPGVIPGRTASAHRLLAR